MNKKEIYRYIGDMSQICDARMVRLVGGKSQDMLAIEVYTGSGLQFTILPDRGLDIAHCSYNGISIAHITKNGLVSPHLYEESNRGFLKNFSAGLLTTCGLTYMGSDCIEDDTYLGIHGRYSNTPAEDININKEWLDNDYIISIEGLIRETRLFGENIVLKRCIKTKMHSSEIEIIDTIENLGFIPTPLMLLYHFNFGYPLISEKAYFNKSESTTIFRDDEAKKGIEDYYKISQPIPSFKEQVFYHENFKNNLVFGEIVNPSLKLSARVTFNKNQLPILVEWKQMGEGDYVFGIEPSTNYPLGRVKERINNRLKYIEPFEKKQFNLKITIKKHSD